MGGKMENQNRFKKLLSKRNIYILFGVAIFLEIIWAGWTFLKPSFQLTTEDPQTMEALIPAVVSLSASQTSLKIGEKITVEINITSNKKTDGTDLVITYDPKLLSVETVGTNKNPVRVGTIYRDYPLNSLEPTLGRIIISGITDLPGGALADGLFGSIVFQAKSQGTANINLDFNPGQTTDSNIIESISGKDILEQVNNLQLTIIP